MTISPCLACTNGLDCMVLLWLIFRISFLSVFFPFHIEVTFLLISYIFAMFTSQPFRRLRIRVDIEFSCISSPLFLSSPPCTRWRDVPSITTLQTIWAMWMTAQLDTPLHSMAATWRSSPTSCKRRRVWKTSSYAHAVLSMGSSLLSVCSCHRTMQQCISRSSRSPQKVSLPLLDFTISNSPFFTSRLLALHRESKIAAVVLVLWEPHLASC